MPKRSRPDPGVTEKWVNRLTQIIAERERRQRSAAEIDEELESAVEQATLEGVLISDLTEPTGLSSSRLFQLKFAKRDRARRSKKKAS